MLEHVRDREWLEPLTGNPMLLTAMCIVYSEGRRLPRDKHELYPRIVDNVHHNRYEADPRQIDPVRNRLCVIAHGMHTGVGLGEAWSTPRAEVTYEQIDRMIQAYRDQNPWTESSFRGAVDARDDLLSSSGLLLPRWDRRAGFYHLSFQDFLAAQRLVDVERDRLADAVRKRAAVAEWRPALSFTFGSLLATSLERSMALLTHLVEQARTEELGLHVVLGEWVEMILARNIRHPGVEDRIRSFCLQAIEREAPLRERHALGLTLGWVGDPRIVVDLRDRSAYVEIPHGEYILGEDSDSRPESGSRRRPSGRRFTLDQSFRIARYPMTNSQYALFVKEGGYEQARWWSEGGRRWLAESGERQPSFWRRGKWNNPSQPVVGVSFWEAEAFCSWAGGRLPSADESECAARGPEGLEYPWGDDWEDAICNTVEARLGMTSAVGLFARARSKAFGLHDMAGNVLEWCRNIAADTTRDGGLCAVVRGGSWYDYAGDAWCAYRFVIPPIIRGGNLGFRMVDGGGARIS